jgi:hypothetical protein
MKKARARQTNNTNDYWDKKLLEVEEKDPNRWRHTGYKKLYIHNGESSSESENDREKFRYNGGPSSRKSPMARKSRSRSPIMRKMSPRPRSPVDRRPRPRPKSPEIQRRRSPPMNNMMKHRLGNDNRMGKRPPSPPPKVIFIIFCSAFSFFLNIFTIQCLF